MTFYNRGKVINCYLYTLLEQFILEIISSFVDCVGRRPEIHCMTTAVEHANLHQHSLRDFANRTTNFFNCIYSRARLKVLVSHETGL